MRTNVGRLMKKPFFVLILMWFVVTATACGDSLMEEDSSGSNTSGNAPTDQGNANPGGDADYTPYVPTGGDSDSGYTEDPLPPEIEPTQAMSLPVTGENYVFVLNRQVGTLVMIEAESLAIRTMPVGNQPGAFATVPGKDLALIIDEETDQIVLADPVEEKVDYWEMGDQKITRYNSLEVSPSGEFAILFFNSLNADLYEESLGSLQDVGVFDLRNADKLDRMDKPIDHYRVGLNPTNVYWTWNGAQAFVLTDMGLTAFDFTNPDDPSITPNIVIEDQIGDPIDREVNVTPDGKYCLVRRFETTLVNMVDLATSERLTLDLEVQPTDLDLTADGKAAVVVLRSQKKLAVIPIPGGFEDDSLIQWVDIPESAGVVELADDSDTMMIYSTLTTDERVWSYSISREEMTTYQLQKGVESVSFAPGTANSGGLTALIYHTKKLGSPLPNDSLYEIIDKSFGYTILHLATDVQTLQLTDADQAEFTFTPDGKKGYVLITDGMDIRKVHIMDLTPPSGALVAEADLGSIPTDVGLIPGKDRVYVSQDHPDGRITFFDTETNAPVTVTGFELNGRIE